MTDQYKWLRASYALYEAALLARLEKSEANIQNLWGAIELLVNPPKW